jgi:hypothetical protein
MPKFDVWKHVVTSTGAATIEELVAKNPKQYELLQEVVRGLLDNNDDLVIDFGLKGLKPEEMVTQLILMLANKFAIITGEIIEGKVQFSLRFDNPAILQTLKAVQTAKGQENGN